MNTLRDITPNDQEMIREWRNRPEIRKYMYTDHEIGAQEHAAWFSRILNDSSRKYWIITCGGEDVGLVNLYNIDNRNHHCYWAFYTASQNARGKGIGSFAEFSILRIVFDEMNLQKLCCEVLAFNQAVINLHKKFGFVPEGLFRKHALKEGELVDVVCLAILREEWEQKKPELEIKLKAKGII